MGLLGKLRHLDADLSTVMKAAEEPVDFNRIPFVLEVWVLQWDIGLSQSRVYIYIFISSGGLNQRESHMVVISWISQPFHILEAIPVING